MDLDIDLLLKSDGFTDFIFNNMTSAIFLVDEELRLQKINDVYKTLFRKEEIDVLNELCGNSLGCSFAIEEGLPCGSTSECSKCSLRKCVLTGFSNSDEIQSTYIARKFYINDKPVFKYFRFKTKCVIYNNKNMAIITADDITELEEQKNKIKEMADKDYLTKLYNRRYLFEYGEKVFKNAKRGYINLSIAMIDIDYFKKINDNYGHDAGDFVLVSLSSILQTDLRSSDIVARMGGEEFCIILNTKENEDGFFVIEKIRKKVEENKFVYTDKTTPVTISCGVTNLIEDTLEEMIKKADMMLYKSKNAGRNQTFLYKK